METADRDYILATLDWYYSVAEMIIQYFEQHNNMSFSTAKETYDLAKAQLRNFLKWYSLEIYNDDAMYNYLDLVTREMQFIEDNLYSL